MAAFSDYQQQYYPAAPFVLDSFLDPEATSNNMSCFSIDHEGTGFSSYFLDPDHETYLHQEITLQADHRQIHESTTRPPLPKSCAAAATATAPAAATHDDPSLSLKHEYHLTSSAKVVELGSSGTHPVEKKRKNMDTMVEREGRDGKCSGTIVRKHGEERRRRFSKKQKKVAVEVPSGFVHVRARRGQATDSHSLAERVRRQKISIRMKLLQSLVPGCDKMTGKALILDEIIRYVRTLQCQVQFLAAKVASFNPMLNDFMDFNTNPLAQDQDVPLHNLQKTCIMDFEQLQPVHVLESSSTQLLHQEQISSNVTFEDNCNLLWSTDDGRRKQEFESHYGVHNLHSF